jgi:ubiquitin-protein ligase
MDKFVFYDLSDVSLNNTKKTKVHRDILMEDVNERSKKSDALFSQGEVASSIINELYKVEEKYPNINIVNVYNLELNNFCNKFPETTIKLTLDKDYYPMLTPDITLNPPIDPIFMYEMISHPDLDVRNTSKIRNINYIISRVNTFLLDYNLECKLNPDITNSLIMLLKNNNYKMKIKEPIINQNITTEKSKSNGIGYGGSVSKWDVNEYLDNITRIKESNINILDEIIEFINTTNLENQDLIEIHNRFNLNSFWIDLIEKYEVTDEKYFVSIYNIMFIMDYLNLKIKIPFLDMFETAYQNKKSEYINKIRDMIYKIRRQDDNVNNHKDEYVLAMKPLQNGSYPYVAKQKHHFVKDVSAFTTFYVSNAIRMIAKQYEIISRSLPLTSESAIFFRQDPDNLCMFKFAVIPNEDTPYKYGIFVFDVFLPPDFPRVPPIVNHTTSRKNNFRFNPNLYSNGYVCLSLLGTWSGQSSEKWIAPNAEGTGSTLYQVIMSIYSMVFSEEPWFNEPGRESGIGSATTNQNAIQYKNEIRDGTIKFAIINQLKYPEEGFEDVIKTHFKLKKDKVITYLKELNKEKEVALFESLLT